MMVWLSIDMLQVVNMQHLMLEVLLRLSCLICSSALGSDFLQTGFVRFARGQMYARYLKCGSNCGISESCTQAST